MLTKEILCAYAPFGVESQFHLSSVLKLRQGVKDEVRLKKVTLDNLPFVLSYCKLILRPPSSLTKPITHNGETFVPMVRLGELALQKLPKGFDDLESATKWVNISVCIGLDEMMYWLVCWLCEHHFDIFGLLESGHAIELKEVSEESKYTESKGE